MIYETPKISLKNNNFRFNSVFVAFINIQNQFSDERVDSFPLFLVPKNHFWFLKVLFECVKCSCIFLGENK